METYLNLGLVGLLILLGLLVSTFRKISKKLTTDFDFARLRLAFLLAIVAFNYTEAAFKGVHLVWTIFCIIAIDYARVREVEHQKPSVVERSRRGSPQPLKNINATSRESTSFHRPRLR
jgi:DMSO/TMAO reductase YedYZ heme-binding membrane subunit